MAKDSEAGVGQILKVIALQVASAIPAICNVTHTPLIEEDGKCTGGIIFSLKNAMARSAEGSNGYIREDATRNAIGNAFEAYGITFLSTDITLRGGRRQYAVTFEVPAGLVMPAIGMGVDSFIEMQRSVLEKRNLEHTSRSGDLRRQVLLRGVLPTPGLHAARVEHQEAKKEIENPSASMQL